MKRRAGKILFFFSLSLVLATGVLIILNCFRRVDVGCWNVYHQGKPGMLLVRTPLLRLEDRGFLVQWPYGQPLYSDGVEFSLTPRSNEFEMLALRPTLVRSSELVGVEFYAGFWHGVPAYGLHVPLLYWVLPLLAWTIWCGWRFVRRRHPIGCCQSCGYDLRASSGRCPECGTTISEKQVDGKFA
jgi:hypothetical protein